MLRRTVALLLCSCFAACDDPAVLRDTAGKRRVLAQVGDPTQVAAQLAAQPKANLVFAASPAFATAAQQALTTREPRPKLVVAGLDPAAARAAVSDGHVTAAVARTDACGDAALLLAGLAARGSTVHKQFALGARWFSKANLAAGGTQVPAPGDVALQVLRMQPTPLSDALLRVQVIVDGSSPWATAVAADVAAAVPNHLGLAVTNTRAATAAAVSAALDAAAGDNPSALLVLTEDLPASRTARERALARGAKVILVAPSGDDACTSHVGPDAETIGRAAGAAIESVAPDGAHIVELAADAAVQRGLHKALALHAPQ